MTVARRQVTPPPRPKAAPPKREKGSPPNGASSMHLSWTIDAPARTVRAILEVTTPPQGDDLYFWALQARFCNADGSGDHGGAHIGLQWHSSFPGHTAVNWGGYTAQGAELPGSTSALPSSANNANTRDYPWKPRRRYELKIAPAADGWAGTVTDLTTKKATTIRTLYAGGARLVDVSVWSEVFAACDARSVAVRWSGLEAAGRPVRAATINFQDYSQGGCTNTNQTHAGATVTQRTKTRRSIDDGQVIKL